jgi:hypothetical protein
VPLASLTRRDAIHLGLDVHNDSISVGILNPGHERPDVERIFHEEASVRALIARFDGPGELRVCYEAGLPATTWPGCPIRPGCPAR